MSKVYEQDILNGIPVYIKGENVYTWERDGGEPIEIGKLDKTDEGAARKFTLNGDWKERTEERMLAWREGQKIRSRAKLRDGGHDSSAKTDE